MSRTFTISLCVSLAIALLLPPIATLAAPAKHHAEHRRIYHWHGYGFLPGYHQPPNNSIPMYAEKRSSHGARDHPPNFFLDYAPSYWYGGWYYYGNPGFFHGRYNGGSYGPCWTSTPIGLMWNCG